MAATAAFSVSLAVPVEMVEMGQRRSVAESLSPVERSA